MRRWILGFFCLLLLFSGCPLWGEEENLLVVRTQEAEYDEKSGKIVARDATLSWRDLSIFCPLLEVDVKTQEIQTQGEVRAAFGNLEARMESLSYSRRTNTLRVTSFQGKAQDLTFSAKEGLFDFGKGVATFSGDPVLLVRGFEVRLGKAEYVFATRRWQGRDVMVSREGWSGKAKRALYTEGTNVLILEGEAEISREGNLLRGERITVNLDTSQVKVEGNVEIFLMPFEEKK